MVYLKYIYATTFT